MDHPPPPERNGSAEATAPPPKLDPRQNPAGSSKFHDLARRLVAVKPEELAEREAQWRRERDAR
jgi:hypothetical protein